MLSQVKSVFAPYSLSYNGGGILSNTNNAFCLLIAAESIADGFPGYTLSQVIFHCAIIKWTKIVHAIPVFLI